MKRPSCFHLFIAGKLRSKADEAHSNLINREDLRKILYYSHVPKIIHEKFLKEMEKCGLIERKNQRKHKILFITGP